MAVSVMARRASGQIFRSVERSNSCPDLSSTIASMKLNQHHLGATTGQVRNLNLMVLHPRAPKIRHLNASHSLLIELEENVKKVQDLESTVLELEKQLQWKEIIKKQNVTLEALKTIKKPQQKTVITEEEQTAFRHRLEEAKKKAAQLTLKRDEEEANILRSWHQQRLKVTIDKMMTKIPEAEVKMLPLPQETNQEALLFSDIDTLVDMANYSPEPTTYKEELDRLEVLLKERDNLGKLYQEVQSQEEQAMASLQECKNALASINTMRSKLNANINLTNTLMMTMQNQQLQRKNQNLFVFGPNPIFNSAKEFELNYSINNQFVQQMLQELDLSDHLAHQNLRAARDCRKQYRENKTKIMESLQSLQATIDSQSQHLTTFHNSIPLTNKKIKAQEKNISSFNQVIQNRD